MTDQLPVIYISGYGRSGSTLLDVLLDAQPDVLGLGEVTHLFRFAAQDRACSCGEKYLACPVWGPTLRTVMHPSRLSLMAAETLTRAVETRRLVSTRTVDRYEDLWGRLLRAAAAAAAATVVVDSSKSTRGTQLRATRLGRVGGLSVRSVHLRRDPQGVLASARAARDRRAAKGVRGAMDGDTITSLRTLAGWVATDRAAAGQADLTVQFEDLVAHPASAILSSLNLVTDVDGAVPTLVGGPGHGVAGNRMRRLGQPIVARTTTSHVSGPSVSGHPGSRMIMSRIPMRMAIRLADSTVSVGRRES